MTVYPHPACMEPDGGEGPCRGYVALNEALDAHKLMLTESSLREGNLLVEIDRLRSALRPFANYADASNMIPDNMKITLGSNFAKRQLTMVDCRRAAATLIPPTNDVKQI